METPKSLQCLIFYIFLTKSFLIVQANFYEHCGKSKFCFGIPTNDTCIKNQNCTIFASFNENESLQINLSSNDKKFSYVALGFSNDDLMGDDFVLECVKQNNQIEFFTSKTSYENRLRVTRRYKKNKYLIKGTGSTNGIFSCNIEARSMDSIGGDKFEFNKEGFYLMLVGGIFVTKSSIGYHEICGTSDIKFNNSNIFKAPFEISPDIKEEIQEEEEESDEIPIGSDNSNDYEYDNENEIAYVQLNEESIYSGCNRTKSCFGVPIDCIKKSSCESIFTLSKSTTKSKILIELMETSYYWNTPESVSAGIFDKSGKGFKLICRRINENIEIKGRSMKITDCDAEDNEEPLNNIEVISSNFDDDFYCKIELNSAFNDGNFSFNINNNNFIVKLDYEHTCLTFKNNFNMKFSKLDKGMSNLVRLHGSLMIFAWIGCNTLAIIISRYFKQNFTEKQFFNKDTWFVVHVTLNFATLFITILSILIALIQLNGVKILKNNFHGLFGFATLFLICAQTLLGTFRPQYTSKHRQKWRYIHWFIGHITHAIAITAIYYSFYIPRLKLLSEAAYWIQIFTGLYIIMHAILIAGEFIEKGNDAYKASLCNESSDKNQQRFLKFSAREQRRIKAFASDREKFLIFYTILIFLYLVFANLVLWGKISSWKFVRK